MFTLISPAKTAALDNIPKCKIKTKTSPQMLDDARIIVEILKNKTPDQLVKILGVGTLTEKVDVEANAFSKKAEAIITEAGGTINKL